MEDAVDPLPPERPQRDAVPHHADDAHDQDQQALSHPLKDSKIINQIK